MTFYNFLLTIVNLLIIILLQTTSSCKYLKVVVQYFLGGDFMNNRGLKNRKPISNAVDIKIYEAFEKLSKDTKIPKSKLLDEALQDLIIKYTNPTK
jgi:hypothetical protein